MLSYCGDCVYAKLMVDEDGRTVIIKDCCPDSCTDSWNDCLNYESVFAAEKGSTNHGLLSST